MIHAAFGTFVVCFLLALAVLEPLRAWWQARAVDLTELQPEPNRWVLWGVRSCAIEDVAPYEFFALRLPVYELRPSDYGRTLVWMQRVVRWDALRGWRLCWRETGDFTLLIHPRVWRELTEGD